MIDLIVASFWFALKGILIASFIVCAVLVLGGCTRGDGPSFSNPGKASRPACVERDRRGNETWRSC